jgi:hypothetical protein
MIDHPLLTRSALPARRLLVFLALLTTALLVITVLPA